METKLKLILKKIHWSLLANAAIFGAAWLWLPFWLFLLVGLVLYFRHFHGASRIVNSFLILLILLLFFKTLNLIDQLNYVVADFASISMFFVLGIKDFIFIYRRSAYHFLNLTLFLAIFLSFFWVGKSLGSILLVIIGSFILFGEFYNYVIAKLSASAGVESILGEEDELESEGDETENIKNLRFVIISSETLILSQFLLAVSLLPIGFLNASALMLLIVFIMNDFFTNHFSGTLDRYKVLRNITVFIVVVLIIFIASRWSL